MRILAFLSKLTTVVALAVFAGGRRSRNNTGDKIRNGRIRRRRYVMG
jgi:hypothetical protein